MNSDSCSILDGNPDLEGHSSGLKGRYAPPATVLRAPLDPGAHCMFPQAPTAAGWAPDGAPPATAPPRAAKTTEACPEATSSRRRTKGGLVQNCFINQDGPACAGPRARQPTPSCLLGASPTSQPRPRRSLRQSPRQLGSVDRRRTATRHATARAPMPTSADRSIESLPWKGIGDGSRDGNPQRQPRTSAIIRYAT